eukprot:CAMPEP_0197022650 /NCGR_PEP_ID=MMETSP1384-20130603/3463_1 /TAXON_ID=29189 /ORGANISM="Ammonia sp." /LENGTH=153 /DNA_ID=CAMNT_0042450725 /DNA_START=73 /DNA_END=534 /DNA_ORIENTATION=-
MSSDSTPADAAETEEKKKLQALFTKKIFKMKEVEQHKSEEHPWVVIYGGVYDMTKFQLDHPGGPDVLQDIAGQDGTDEFENILHTEKARKMGNDYLIGSIEGADFNHWYEHMSKVNTSSSGGKGDDQLPIGVILFVVGLGVAAYYYYTQQQQS